jgi:CsoR family transcriptional regulator, copper-sensing transcriptional repressor
MDTTKKDELCARLKRIAGQVGGVERMVDEERACLDVLVQVNAARAALTKVSRLLLKDHLQTTVADLATKGGRDKRQTLDELMRVLERCEL